MKCIFASAAHRYGARFNSLNTQISHRLYRCAATKIAQNAGRESRGRDRPRRTVHLVREVGLLQARRLPGLLRVAEERLGLEAALRRLLRRRGRPLAEVRRHLERSVTLYFRPVFYAILVPAHLYFSRCASERERSERERCASSRVPLASDESVKTRSGNEMHFTGRVPFALHLKPFIFDNFWHF